MKKLYVGNLSYQATETQLEDWFARAGVEASSIHIVRDRFSGEPRGFGFVEVSDEQAERAIDACNGREFLGRTLVVNEARPMREGGGGRQDRGGGFRGGRERRPRR